MVDFCILLFIMHFFCYAKALYMFSRSADPLLRLFAELFPRPKPATLPAEVIEAIRLYNKPCHKEILAAFMKSGNKHAVDSEARSVLHHAVLFGKPFLVTYFLQKKVHIELEDNRGYTPLILAAQEVCGMHPSLRAKVMACMEILLEAKAHVISTGLFPQSAVNLVAAAGDLEVLLLLERHGAPLNDDNMGSPLWWATRSKITNPEMITYLQEKGCTARMEASI